MGQQTYSSGSGSWTVPDGVTSITLLLIGGGGGGASAGGGGGGGGGGSISRTSYSVTPFSSISYSVGAGGFPDSNGGNTTFGALTAGGGAGAFSSSTGGAGGTGDFTGGAGGSQISVPNGGGGGGSGGRSANGNNGANSNAGSAGGAAVSEGGAGGAGAVDAGDPSNGVAPGGGGGGSNAMTVGGSGAAGFIQIDWDDGGGGAGSGIYWTDTFMTFRNVSVPKRATINKAFVRFTAKAGSGITNAEDTVEAMIFGNDVDDSSPPTDLSTYTAKALTDSCQSWEAIGHWTDEATYDSPDVACIIQEIVDRSGWASGNDISLYVQNNFSTEQSLHYIARRAYDYGTSSSKSPQLFIYYTLEESGSGGVVVGGSVTSTIIRSESASGGVVVGGAGTVISLRSETGSGGVVISGTATVAGGHTIYVETGSGGVVIGGTGQPIYSEIASGGVVCGSSATVNHAIVIVASGGVVVSGARWLYRRRLLVPNGRVGEYLDKFYLPVAINLDPAKASSNVNFTDSQGNDLAFELREYDAMTGNLWAFVKTPLKATSDNTIFIYYGDNS